MVDDLGTWAIALGLGVTTAMFCLVLSFLVITRSTVKVEKESSQQAPSSVGDPERSTTTLVLMIDDWGDEVVDLPRYRWSLWRYERCLPGRSPTGTPIYLGNAPTPAQAQREADAWLVKLGEISGVPLPVTVLVSYQHDEGALTDG